MPTRLGPRFAIEAGFLLLVAFLLAWLDFGTTAIIAVMFLAFLLVAGVEWFASREALEAREAQPVEAERTPVDAYEDGPTGGFFEADGDAETAVTPLEPLEPLEPRPARRWPWQSDAAEAQDGGEDEPELVAQVVQHPAEPEEAEPEPEPEAELDAEVDVEEAPASGEAGDAAGVLVPADDDELEPDLEPEPEPARDPPVLTVVPTPADEPELEPPGEADEEQHRDGADVVQFPVPQGRREWNLWELERLARERAGEDPARDEEWAYLLMYLREFASSDGVLPADFDALVRESFAAAFETPGTR